MSVRIRNTEWTHLAELRPVDGHWESEKRTDYGDGTYGINREWVSNEGHRQLTALAELFDLYRADIELLMDRYGSRLCDHGYRLDDESHSWSLNDYAFDWETERDRAVFDTWGFHWDAPGEPFCMPAEYVLSPWGNRFVWSGS